MTQKLDRSPVFRSICRDQRGFSLVELMLVLVLLVFVLGIGYNFYSFGATTFAIGERQSDIQQNARLAADFITREVRFAENMTFVEDPYEYEEGGGLAYYYLFVEGGKLMHRKTHKEEDVNNDAEVLLENISGSTISDLEFRASDLGGNLLYFDLTITDVNGERSFTLETEILLVNVDQIDGVSLAEGTSAVRYQVPAPPDPTIVGVTIEPPYHVENINETQIVVAVATFRFDEGTKVEAAFFEFSPFGYISPFDSPDQVDVITGASTTVAADDTAGFTLTIPTEKNTAGIYVIEIAVDEEPKRKIYPRYYEIFEQPPEILSFIANMEDRGDSEHPTKVLVKITTNWPLVGKHAYFQILGTDGIDYGYGGASFVVQKGADGGGIIEQIFNSNGRLPTGSYLVKATILDVTETADLFVGTQ